MSPSLSARLLQLPGDVRCRFPPDLLLLGQVCKVQRFYDDRLLPWSEVVSGGKLEPRRSWCTLGKLARMAVRQAPNPDKLSLDEIAGQAQDHVEDIYEWTVVEEKKLSGEPPLEPFEALCQRIENGLKGQALELFRFLKGRTQWTRFDTLADERRLWRGCDSPSNQAVTKALKRLVSKLVRLHAHCDLEIRAKEGRTKLTFYEPGRR